MKRNRGLEYLKLELKLEHRSRLSMKGNSFMKMYMTADQGLY